MLALLGVADKRAFLRGGWSCFYEFAARQILSERTPAHGDGITYRLGKRLPLVRRLFV